jgi:hypothetical protein
MPRSEGAVEALALSVTLEAMCRRFEAGHVPRVQDVRYIRQASVALKRLAFVTDGLSGADDG